VKNNWIPFFGSGKALVDVFFGEFRIFLIKPGILSTFTFITNSNAAGKQRVAYNKSNPFSRKPVLLFYALTSKYIESISLF